MEANSDLGTDIHQHGTIPTSGVIRPIETWSTDDVWDHLLKPDWVGGGQNPFFTVNQKLATLYRDAASGSARSSMTQAVRPVREAGSVAGPARWWKSTVRCAR